MLQGPQLLLVLDLGLSVSNFEGIRKALTPALHRGPRVRACRMGISACHSSSDLHATVASKDARTSCIPIANWLNLLFSRPRCCLKTSDALGRMRTWCMLDSEHPISIAIAVVVSFLL